MTCGVVLSALLISFAYSTKANVILQQIMAQNEPPVIDNVVVSLSENGSQVTEMTMTENTDTGLYVYGSASDPNGCHDLKRVNVTVYRADLGAACELNDNNCYATSTQVFASCSSNPDLGASFQAVLQLESFADPTDAGSPNAATNWIARVTVLDQGDLSATALSPGFEINSLAALGVTPSLDFGELHLGETSQPKVIYLTNYGNRSVQPDFVSQGDLACDSGTSTAISSSMLHMHTADQVAACNPTQGGGLTSANDKLIDCTVEQIQTVWNAGVSMESDQVRTYETGLDEASGYGSSMMPVYFTLKIPGSGVLGSCSTILRVTAVAR